MKVVGVFCGTPKIIRWRHREISTAIFKSPVDGPVAVGELGIAGDKVADNKYHGGSFKAVYSYAAEHYDFWRRTLDRDDLCFGSFGENITIADSHEDQVRLGDRFAIGTSVLEAVSPRIPCFKLGIRLNDDSMVGRFAEAGRSGIYYRVVQPGTFAANDAVELSQPGSGPLIKEIYSAVMTKDRALAQTLLKSAGHDPAIQEKLTKIVNA